MLKNYNYKEEYITDGELGSIKLACREVESAGKIVGVAGLVG